MIYCRWSSDGWRSDVYVYEDCRGGWTTHVAAKKRVHPDPCPNPFEHVEDEVLFRLTYEEERRWLEEATLEPIGLPHDGETFNDPTPGSCAARLRSLQLRGYHVPDYAIEELTKEASSDDD